MNRDASSHSAISLFVRAARTALMAPELRRAIKVVHDSMQWAIGLVRSRLRLLMPTTRIT